MKSQSYRVESSEKKRGHNRKFILLFQIGFLFALITVALKLSCFSDDPSIDANQKDHIGTQPNAATESKSLDEITTVDSSSEKAQPDKASPVVIKDNSIWCIPEYWRIDAVSGQSSELGFSRLPDDYKLKNEIYDFSTNSVSLVGLRGETVAFQIMFEGDLEDLSFKAANFPGTIEFFYEGYLHFFNKEKNRVCYMPEVALPMDWIGNQFNVQTVPTGMPLISEKNYQAVFVDVKIPRIATPGEWSCSINIMSGDKTISELSVNIRILEQAIPEQPEYLNAMIHYGFFAKRAPTVELEAYRIMHEHRMSIHDVPYSSQRGWGIEGAVPKTTFSPVFERVGEIRDKANELAKNGEYILLPELEFLKDSENHTVKGDDLDYRLNDTLPMHDMVLRACREIYEKEGAGIVDWTDFDKRYSSMLDGTAFEDGIPLASFELPFNFNWPCPLDRFEKDNPKQSEFFENVWKEVAADFLTHAKEKGWTRTQFFVYFNPKDSNNNLSMWKGDEPCEKGDFLFHQYIMGLFNKVFANKGDIKVDYKLEVGHWECDHGMCPKRNYDNKTWDEANARELLKDVEVWVPNSRHFHSSNDLAKEQIASQGDRFYTYGGLSSFDESSMSVYGIAFLGFEDSSLGFFYYIPDEGKLSDWSKAPGALIEKSKIAKPNNNIFHYDPTPFGKPDSFLPSLRLKELRSVESHYAAFKLAGEKNQSFADDLRSRMVKYIANISGPEKGMKAALVNNNPADLHRARLAALAIVSGDPSILPSGDYQGPLKNVIAKTDAFHYCVKCGEACNPATCEWCGALQE
ncbi:MAG: hypothetical protein ABIH86_01175 [Planctomycetota bacterium]